MESAKPQRSTRGGLAGAMIRRQRTGGRGVGNNCSPAAILLQSTGSLKKRLRVQLEGVPEMIADVRKSLNSGDHTGLLQAVFAVRNKLIEGTSAPFDLPVRPNRSRTGGGGGGGGAGGGGSGAEPYHGHNHGHNHEDDGNYDQHQYHQVRRLDREAFVSLGGPDLLLEVLRGPDSLGDARRIPADIVARDMPVWKMILAILRELCFMDQDLSERLGSPELILYLLTLMAHQEVFDLAVGLVEEILAVKSSTYYLGDVPELHSLVENMTSQQLAHFSRVLALLVFEPEYRQLMESAHVLRSMELLQLRRDRVVRADSIIDKNQALILSAPNLLQRLMELLRVMNFNPSLALFAEHARELEEAAHGTLAQFRISVIAEHADGGRGRSQLPPPPPPSDWGYLADLRSVAEAEPQSAEAEAEAAGAAAAAAAESVQTGRAPPTGAQQPPASGGARGSHRHARSSGSGSGSGEAESRGIIGFLRSIFGRLPATTAAAPAAAGAAVPSQAPAAATAGGEDANNPNPGPRPSEEEARAAAVDGQERRRAAARAEEHPGAGIDIPPYPGDAGAGFGSDGQPSFAIRDLLSFLQPALDPAGSIASLEQAMNWPGGIGMIGTGPVGLVGGGVMRRRLQRPTAEQARQELQVNGLLLAPHQVEVLFVLCTLLGARRKGEAHQALANLGLIDVLDSMFDRLSWGHPASTQGPHGPHCDCNPESALRVQYLRLVHNFLDRDSNNNPLKWLLLSAHERTLFSSGRFMPNPNGSGNVVFLPLGAPESEAQLAFVWRGRPTFSGAEEGDGEGSGGQGGEGAARPWVDTRGLLSKIVDVFMKEPMDSLYRFWLASCVEAFLRGGSTQEQLFISGGGLLPHLVKEITSSGMWCAGSLQTAFDLLGELCKGNREVLEMLEASMTEKQLRRFLQVMVDNLVDSNVFMRSLVLSVEHRSFQQEFPGAGMGEEEEEEEQREDGDEGGNEEDEETAPRLGGKPAAAGEGGKLSAAGGDGGGRRNLLQTSIDAQQPGDDVEGVSGGEGGHGGEVGNWLDYDADEEPCYLGHTWYDVQPQEVVPEETEGCAKTGERGELEEPAVAAGAALVRDLMCVVNLETINHENICCLNTAVLILIFADRRGQLAELLEAVRKLPAGKGSSTEEEIDSEFDLDGDEPVGNSDGDGDGDGDDDEDDDDGERDSLAWPSSRARTTSKSGGGGGGGGCGGGRCHHADPQADDDGDGDGCKAKGAGAQDGPTVLRNFRRLLWFWGEYYLRGGRDRLSLEFSTHVKFWAWKKVIRLLCADDGSPTALVDAPLPLPRSPYDAVRPSSSSPSSSSWLPAAAASTVSSEEKEREQEQL
eukprot:g8401.t1